MASIKKLDERRYKITVSNGYRPNGKKISKAKTIQVPPGVPKRGIGQYVAHAAEELERSFKTGYAEDGEMTFEEFASRWLNRQAKYAPSTIAAYRRMLEVVYPMIGGIRLNKLRPMALENILKAKKSKRNNDVRAKLRPQPRGDFFGFAAADEPLLPQAAKHGDDAEIICVWIHSDSSFFDLI